VFFFYFLFISSRYLKLGQPIAAKFRIIIGSMLNFITQVQKFEGPFISTEIFTIAVHFQRESPNTTVVATPADRLYMAEKHVLVVAMDKLKLKGATST